MNEKLERNVMTVPRMVILVLNYFVGYMYVYPWLLTFVYYYFDLSINVYNWLSFSVYLLMIIISVAAGYPVLKESLKKIIRPRKFFEYLLLVFVALYMISAFTSSLVTLITGMDQSANQQSVILAFFQNPLLIGFTTLVYAPIVEEVVFRGALFRGLRSYTNFWTAGLISALAFGSIHIIDSLFLGNFIDLWYLLTYGSLGFIFCFIYEKTHSIYGSMALHFLNNFLGIIGILLTYYFI